MTTKTTANGTPNRISHAVQLPEIEIVNLDIPIVGDSPLICHRWSEKAKKEMLDKQMKKARKGREAKDPVANYADSLYWLSKKPAKPTPANVAKGKFCFPSVAFKAAAVGACRYVDGMKMTEARGAFHVENEFVDIQGSPEMREDMVRVGMGTADIRYRGQFVEWSVDLTVVVNVRAMSIEQVVNLFNIAGFGVGVGEWRPEKNGSYGRFHVATE